MTSRAPRVLAPHVPDDRDGGIASPPSHGPATLWAGATRGLRPVLLALVGAIAIAFAALALFDPPRNPGDRPMERSYRLIQVAALGRR
jgi:hypothetical protein